MIRVLMVCTGNICRSPTAEAVLRSKLTEQGLDHAVEVDSAGTESWHTGNAPARMAVVCGAARDYGLSPLRARQLRPGDFHDFDLILAMDRGHLDHLMARCPENARATVKSFMDFADRGPADIPDPYYGDKGDYEVTLDLIESAMPGLLEALQVRRF